MTEAEARARLERMIAINEAPLLDPSDVDDLIALSKRADSDGLAPSDPAWTPTWNLNAGAAEGWRTKAGRCSDKYSFGIDGQMSSQSDVFKHCQAMVAQYEKGESGSARVSGMIDDDEFGYLDTRSFGPIEWL